MAQYKFGKAIVRIHGSVDREYIEKATIAYLKKVQNKKERVTNGNKYSSRTVDKK